MIPLNSKMSQDQKFLQRWEFRRRDDDLDSSSEDSKLSSSGEAVLKNNELVPDLILPKNYETRNTPMSQRESQKRPDRGIPFEFGKADRMHVGPRKKNNAVKNKMKMGSMKKRNRKNNNRIKHEPVSLDNFKIFMKSITEELKVARENLFTWMREEMKKLVAVELASRPKRKEGSGMQKIGEEVKHQNNIESGLKTQNCNGGSLERSVKNDRTADLNNCFEVLEERVNHDRTIGTITSNGKEKVERARLSVKKPICSSNLSDQVITSSYLPSPTVLSEPQVENHRLDSSCNYIQPGASGNKTGMNLERANLVINTSTHRGYFPGIQQAEQFGSFTQNMDYFNRYNTQTSTMATGFPVPLHQGLGNGFNTPSQAVMENSSRDNNSLGLRMSGGAIRFSGGSHALSEHFVTNNFRSQVNYKTDGRLLAFGRQDLKDGHLYPNQCKE